MADAEAEIKAMHARFTRLTERRAVKGVRELYDAEQSALVRDIARSLRGARGELTDVQRHHIEQRTQVGQVNIARRLAEEISNSQVEAHRDSLHGMARFVSRMEGKRTSLDTSARFEAVLDARRSAMLNVLQYRTAENAAHIASVATDTVSMGAANKLTTKQVLNDLEQSLDESFWRIERLTRTEVSYAYNAAQNDGIIALQKELPDIMSRWTELINDSTGMPMDNRVANDSIAMHGQVTPPNGVFTMPSDETVSAKVWGKTWSFPPNRPHDRAIVMPWRRDWSIPAWIYRGRKVWLTKP